MKLEERLAIMLKIEFGTETDFTIKSVHRDGEYLTAVFRVHGMPKDFVWHFNVGSLTDENETVSTNP